MMVRSCGLEKLGFGAFIGSFIIVVNICQILKPYFGLPPIHYYHLKSTAPIIHKSSNFRSDVYDIEGDIRIHGLSSTIFITSSPNQNLTSWKPHGYTWLNTTRNITYFNIKTDAPDRIPHCTRNLRNIPAIVFPGQTHDDNHFHAFSDVLFPLFSTSHHFNRRVIFLVTFYHPPWISKYRAILENLSKYHVYDVDKNNEVLCFSRMILGLRSPNSLFIHPSESADFPMGNFTKFLRNVYSLDRQHIQDHRLRSSRPRLLIITRKNSRRLMNIHEIGSMARGLGFDVVVTQMSSNLSQVAKLVNSVDVLVGVHGAGLTNMVFLPENAILVQITPYGVDIEAKICFQWAAQCMKLRYLEYKVGLNESSLSGKYPPDSEFYRYPSRIRNTSYARFHGVYLDNQDFNLDTYMFRKTMMRALQIIGA